MNIKNRFCICDYGGLKKRAAERGIVKTNITIGIKDKRVEPPEFPNGRLFTVSSEEDFCLEMTPQISNLLVSIHIYNVYTLSLVSCNYLGLSGT